MAAAVNLKRDFPTLFDRHFLWREMVQLVRARVVRAAETGLCASGARDWCSHQDTKVNVRVGRGLLLMCEVAVLRQRH